MLCVYIPTMKFGKVGEVGIDASIHPGGHRFYAMVHTKGGWGACGYETEKEAILDLECEAKLPKGRRVLSKADIKTVVRALDSGWECSHP